MSQAKTSYLIDTLSTLGQKLVNPNDELLQLIVTEQHYNAWFTPIAVSQAVKAVGHMLNRQDLSFWLENEELAIKSKDDKQQVPPSGGACLTDRQDLGGALEEDLEGAKIGLVLAGNIPLVGFHDVLCVLVSGRYAMIKASTNDARLLKYVLKLLTDIAPEFGRQFNFADRLAGFDAVIATGSNNTSRYFDYYFGKVPNIIRKNRNSVALLTGSETKEQLFMLGHDIFDYFGLGCRNVSKILVPAGYDFVPFFEAIEPHQPVINHHKYNNNYDYNKSIYLVNGDNHFDNGFLLLKEDVRLTSPLAVVFFEYYENLQAAEDRLNEMAEAVQCIVTTAPVKVVDQVVGFGKSQQPSLWDYADRVNTLAFLNGL